MHVKRVLIPTDFSENSHKAITAGQIFIDLFDCKIDLIHVVPLSSYLGESISNLGIPIDVNSDVYPKIVEEANKKLIEFSKQHFNADEVGELFLPVDRKPANAIIEQSEKEDYDLIIMSAKGEHASDFLHGSVTEKVIRNSKIPVLALDNHIHNSKIKTILLATDLSQFSLEVIPVAFELAHKFNASIKLLHVQEIHSSGLELSQAESISVEAFTPIEEEKVYEQIRTRIEHFFNDLEGGVFSLKRNEEPYFDEIVQTKGSQSITIPIRTVIQKGITAHHEIIEYANEHAELLLMATHGKTGLKRMLLGSTTEQVIQHLEMPVLTIKPDVKELT